MTKINIGLAFLTIASFLTIYFIFRITNNPNSMLRFETLISGELGLKWTTGVILFNSFFFSIIFLLFKFGIKWTKPVNKTNRIN